VFAHVVVLVSAMLAGCANQGSGQDADVVWEGREGFVGGPPVELQNGSIYFLWYGVGGVDAPAELREIDSTGNLRKIKVRSADCSFPYLGQLRMLDNGQLGGMQICATGNRGVTQLRGSPLASLLSHRRFSRQTC
jgi:hypothetical protein